MDAELKPSTEALSTVLAGIIGDGGIDVQELETGNDVSTTLQHSLAENVLFLGSSTLAIDADLLENHCTTSPVPQLW